MGDHPIKTERTVFTHRRIMPKPMSLAQNEVVAKLNIGKKPVSNIITDPWFVSNVLAIRDNSLNGDTSKFILFKNNKKGTDKAYISPTVAREQEAALLDHQDIPYYEMASVIESVELRPGDLFFAFQGVPHALTQLFIHGMNGFVFNNFLSSKDTYLLLMQRNSDKILINEERFDYELGLTYKEEFKRMDKIASMSQEQYHKKVSRIYMSALPGYGLSPLLVRYSEAPDSHIDVYWHTTPCRSFDERFTAFMKSTDDPYTKMMSDDGTYVSIGNQPSEESRDKEMTGAEFSQAVELLRQGYISLNKVNQGLRLSVGFLENMITEGGLVPDRTLPGPGGKKQYFFRDIEAVQRQIKKELGVKDMTFTKEMLAEHYFKVSVEVTDVVIELMKEKGVLVELPGLNGQALYRDTDLPEFEKALKEVRAKLKKLKDV